MSFYELQNLELFKEEKSGKANFILCHLLKLLYWKYFLQYMVAWQYASLYFQAIQYFVPLIAIQTIGFIYIAYLSIVHSSFNKKSGQIEEQILLSVNIIKDNANYNKVGDPVHDKTKTDTLNTVALGKTNVRTAPPTNCGEDEKRMKSKYHRLWLVGILGFIAFGAGMAFYGYQATIYPIDRAVGYLSRAKRLKPLTC